MSAGVEMEQMLDSKGRRHIDSLKLGNSLANWPSVANVVLVNYSITKGAFPAPSYGVGPCGNVKPGWCQVLTN